MKEAFHELFKRGHSPSSALKSIKFDLQVKYGDDYYKHAADGSQVPSYKWGYNLYYSIFKQKYGEKTGEGMIDSLQEFIEKYNESCGSICAKMATEGDDIAVAICSPLMKRVHELLRSSGEVVFVDSSGNMDFENTRVFLFNTASVAGGLPLGVVFTTSEATYPLTNAFKLLKDILPEKAFHGRGKEGPKIFMTDDCKHERHSLRSTFKADDLVLLLCKFHFLQAIWRFLLDSSHGVKSDCRVELFFLTKQIINCTDIQRFNDMYDEFLNLTIVKENKKYEEHMKNKRRTAGEWAMAFRQNTLIRGHNTNNYNEVGTKNIKEDVMSRLKSFNMTQLFDFMTVSYDAYCKRRIADCLCNRMTNYRSSRYFIDEAKIANLKAEVSSDCPDIYFVENKDSKQTYKVDLSIDICSCPRGVTGAPCKHQYFVVKMLGRSSSQFLPLNDPEAKLLLHKIMTGSDEVPVGWYDSHKASNAPQPTSTVNDISEAPSDFSVETTEDSAHEETADIGGDNSINNEETEQVTEQQKAISDKIDQICEDMKRRVRDRPEVYLPAFERFSQRYDECAKTESTYISALHTFNRTKQVHALRKDTSTGDASIKNDGMVTGWGMKKMTVQPTAIGRRTTFLGGRQAKIPGRPASSIKNLKRPADEPNWANLPSIKRKAPHNMSQTVLRTLPALPSSSLSHPK